MLPVVLLFVWGLIVGSALATWIGELPERLPTRRGLLTCDGCGADLGATEAMPLVSYVMQGARCRHCGRTIPWRYPVVELTTALLFAWTASVRGLNATLFPALLLEATLIVAAGSDLERRRIPNRLILMALALAVPALLPLPRVLWGQALLGGALLFALTYVLALVTRGGLGGGDVKLTAVMGLLLGVRAGFVALLAAFLMAGVASLVLLLAHRKGRQDTIPFGPYLAMGGILGVFYGNSVVHWYMLRLH
jgi:prepilin signal peptidase PulO-like enzyme (type II secretory pathway)